VWGRRRCGGTAPHHRTDADVDDGQAQQRNDVDGRCEPRDVQRQGPVGLEVTPAVVDARPSRRKLHEVEDDQLRYGEDTGGDPRHGDEPVRAGSRPRMTTHRMTDGDVAIQRGRYEHVRRAVQHKDLRKLDQLAHESAPVEPMSDVPQQLCTAPTRTCIQVSSSSSSLLYVAVVLSTSMTDDRCHQCYHQHHHHQHRQRSKFVVFGGTDRFNSES